MARKLQPVDNIPAPSSSDDDSQDGSGSSSSDDEQQQPQQISPLPPKPQEESDDDSDDETQDNETLPVVKKPSLQQADDESDDDSDETPNSPSASAFTIRPSVSKAVAKSPDVKTPTSKPPRVKSRANRPVEGEEPDQPDKGLKPVLKNQEPGIGKGKGGSSKRVAESEAEKIGKASKSKKSKGIGGEGQSVGKVEKEDKGKKVVSGDEEGGEVEEKKSIIKWHWKDEMALLAGIVDYKEQTGDDWKSKLDDFHEFAKGLLSVDLTKNQLSEKVKRLKKKFQTNLGKLQNGEELAFSKPHESKLFELSQKIWGEGTVTEGKDSKTKSSKRKNKKDEIVVGNADTSTPVRSDSNRELFVQDEQVKETIVEDRRIEVAQDFCALYPRLCASLESELTGNISGMQSDKKGYVNQIISGMGEEKARELEDEWKSINAMEHQIYAKKTLLISDQAQAIIAGLPE